MRNWHYLHPSKATGWPGQSVALSVVCSAGAVTDGSQMRRSSQLLGWSAILWRGDQGRAEAVASADGIDRDSFWRWLYSKLRKGKGTWIWQMHACHGLAAIGLWQLLTQRQWRIVGDEQKTQETPTDRDNGRRVCGCIVSDPPTLLHTSPCIGPGSVHWLDVRNLGITDWTGVYGDDGQSDRRHDACEWSWQTGREIATGRARALAVWLQSWYETVRELKLGGLRGTAAAQSWHGWRTNYLDTVIEVHNDERRLRAERASVYGGRNECYYLGIAQHGAYEIDASGHYPAVASNNTLPGRIAGGERFAGYSPTRIAQAGYCVIARGELWTQQPVLPYRRDGHVCYPTGHWTGTYCWPEWQLLLDTGGKVRWIDWWVYEPTDPFVSFFKVLWDARRRAKLSGRTAQATAIKLLMNSLIGKCCSQDFYWQDRPDLFYPQPWYAWQEPDGDGQAHDSYRTIAWRVQQRVCAGEGDESVPALASYVYSLGRVQLWEWMQSAGWDNVYYCDTDSLWTNGEGYDRIRAAYEMDSGELGGLRLEGRHAWARFYGHKHYETPNGVTCAGIPRNGLLRSGDGWTYWTADTPALAARRGEEVTSELIRYDVSDRVAYRGGERGGDGTVYPYEVNDDG